MLPVVSVIHIEHLSVHTANQYFLLLPYYWGSALVHLLRLRITSNADGLRIIFLDTLVTYDMVDIRQICVYNLLVFSFTIT